MRILLLTPHFFPYQNPRADRWTAIAREWAKVGHEVHVICSRHGDDEGHSVWDGIHLHRTGYNALKEWAYVRFPKTPQRGHGQTGRLPTFLALANRFLLRSWYWPDDAWIWIPSARKKALDLLSNGKWDALVSVSLPFSSHWIASSLKTLYPNLQWLADIGDPLSLQKDHSLNNPLLYRAKNSRAEKAILQAANLVVVTNDGLRQAYFRQFPDLKTPIEVIPPLASFQRKGSISPQPFQIGYFGSFFRGIREPGPLLKLLKALPNPWILNLYGPVFEEFLPVFAPFRDKIRFHGMVSRQAAQAAMQNMEALILLGNTTSFQLPSKWADYLLSGRPVIHLRQTPDDPALDLLERSSMVKSILTTEKNWERKALAFLESCRHQQPGKDELKKWEHLFSPAAIAAAYEGLLLRKITK